MYCSHDVVHLFGLCCAVLVHNVANHTVRLCVTHVIACKNKTTITRDSVRDVNTRFGGILHLMPVLFCSVWSCYSTPLRTSSVQSACLSPRRAGPQMVRCSNGLVRLVNKPINWNGCRLSWCGHQDASVCQ